MYDIKDIKEILMVVVNQLSLIVCVGMIGAC